MTLWLPLAKSVRVIFPAIVALSFPLRLYPVQLKGVSTVKTKGALDSLYAWLSGDKSDILGAAISGTKEIPNGSRSVYLSTTVGAVLLTYGVLLIPELPISVACGFLPAKSLQ